MKAFYDIGELGWALYLSAHIKWLDDPDILVFTDREALFRGCKTIKIPSLFIDKYRNYPEGCFSRHGVSYREAEDFFKKYLPKGYELQKYNTYNYKEAFAGERIFSPYKVMSNVYEGAVVVFPRRREHKFYTKRNLPEQFYNKLVLRLLEETKGLVLSAGTHRGAYRLTVKDNRFIDLVGNTDIQDLIDICTNAKATIGGTSAPPKIALLQGTPSYIIGHERDRFTVEENWSNTEVSFWDVPENGYNAFTGDNCIEDIIKWLK